MFTKSTKVSSVSSLQSFAALSAAALSAIALAGCAAGSTRGDDEAARNQKQAQAQAHDQEQQVPSDGNAHTGVVADPVVAPVTIDQSEDGKSVEVGAGQAIIVRLPSNGTTGYEWSVASDPTPLGQPEVTYLPAGDASAPGAGGSTQLLWADTKTVASGHYAISLRYERSWEPDAIDTFSFVVDLGR